MAFCPLIIVVLLDYLDCSVLAALYILLGRKLCLVHT